MKTIFKPINLVLALMAVGILASSSRSQSSRIGDNLPWGRQTDGIQMSLSSSDAKGSELQVALRNVGRQDVTLNLGDMLANGRVDISAYYTICAYAYAFIAVFFLDSNDIRGTVAVDVTK